MIRVPVLLQQGGAEAPVIVAPDAVLVPLAQRRVAGNAHLHHRAGAVQAVTVRAVVARVSVVFLHDSTLRVVRGNHNPLSRFFVGSSSQAEHTGGAPVSRATVPQFQHLPTPIISWMSSAISRGSVTRFPFSAKWASGGPDE